VESVTAALSNAEVPDDFRFSMVNPEGKGAYPIAGVTWLLVYEQQKDPAKGKKIVDFLKWMLTDGGKMAGTLHYAPLPNALQRRVLARVETIKF
jgi:phosphate transport system substrate-binding protein